MLEDLKVNMNKGRDGRNSLMELSEPPKTARDVKCPPMVTTADLPPGLLGSLCL